MNLKQRKLIGILLLWKSSQTSAIIRGISDSYTETGDTAQNLEPSGLSGRVDSLWYSVPKNTIRQKHFLYVVAVCSVWPVSLLHFSFILLSFPLVVKRIILKVIQRPVDHIIYSGWNSGLQGNNTREYKCIDHRWDSR